jgi:hypothetical protein
MVLNLIIKLIYGLKHNYTGGYNHKLVIKWPLKKEKNTVAMCVDL